MTFTVKHRTNSGSIAEKVVEAANRADCFAKCKVQGISPIGVEDGTAPRKTTSASGPVTSGKSRFVLLVVALAAVGAAVWLICDEYTIETRKAEPIKNVRTENPSPLHGTNKAKQREAKMPSGVGRGTTAVDNPVVVKPDAQMATNTAEDARIKKWKDKFAKRRSIFSNASDQILGMIVNAVPGRDMPPMPITKSIDHDFMKSLETPIVINEDDSNEIKAVKRAVMEMRAEVLAIKDSQGLTVYEILTQHQDLMRENAKIRMEVQKEALDLYKSGDVEGTREFLDKVNVKMDELGAEHIKMPGTQNPELRQRIRDSLDRLKKRKKSNTQMEIRK